jgi:acyl carrier protein
MTEKEVIDMIGDALGLPEGRVTAGSAFGEFAEWDSMGALMIVTVLDRQGIKVPPAEIDRIASVKGILDLFRANGRLT